MAIEHKVIVVEYNEFIRMQIVEYLTEAGYSIAERLIKGSCC